MTAPVVPHDQRPKVNFTPRSNLKPGEVQYEGGWTPPPPNPWLEFLARYAEDPVLFVREVLGADPHPNQLAMLEAYGRRERLISMRSGHRVGKTTTLAWIIIHQLVVRCPQKTVCTAPTTKQLFEALRAETVMWFGRLPGHIQALYEVKSEEIILRKAPAESFVSFRTSSAEKPEALAGVHSEWVLLICDEASGIPEAIFEGAIGSLAGKNVIQILAGNPVRRSGLFYDTFHKLRSRWTTFHVSCVGHPNVTPAFIEDVASRYGERSNAYRVRVLGEFPLADDDTVIPYELIESALHRDVAGKQVTSTWGLDVARKGRDACALAKRRGNVLEEKVRIWRGKDTMETVGIVKSAWDETPIGRRPLYIFVDAIGLGAGVADRLRELGLPAISVNVSETAALSEKYERLRSELWFKGRDFLDKKDCSLAGDEDLAFELALPIFDYTSSGKLKVEEKKLTVKRTGEQSPNRADAFLLTLVNDAATALGLTSEAARSWKEPIRRVLKGLV